MEQKNPTAHGFLSYHGYTRSVSTNRGNVMMHEMIHLWRNFSKNVARIDSHNLKLCWAGTNKHRMKVKVKCENQSTKNGLVATHLIAIKISIRCFHFIFLGKHEKKMHIDVTRIEWVQRVVKIEWKRFCSSFIPRARFIHSISIARSVNPQLPYDEQPKFIFRFISMEENPKFHMNVILMRYFMRVRSRTLADKFIWAYVKGCLFD